MRRITVSQFTDTWLEGDDIVIKVRSKYGGDTEIDMEIDEAIKMNQAVFDTITSGDRPTHQQVVEAGREPRFDQEKHGGG